jgi:hypothetical protein
LLHVKQLELESSQQILKENGEITQHETEPKTAEVELHENDTRAKEEFKAITQTQNDLSSFYICKYPLILFMY